MLNDIYRLALKLAMIEVFKTNVINEADAKKLVNQIHQNFINYQANFDLDDCDLILRIENSNGTIPPHQIISLLKQNGFYAEVLDDCLDTITNSVQAFFL